MEAIRNVLLLEMYFEFATILLVSPKLVATTFLFLKALWVDLYDLAAGRYLLLLMKYYKEAAFD